MTGLSEQSGLVSVSDEARRRLEHDLHDGAQLQLVLSVTDDGPGGADVHAGTGLRGLMDRWAAVGGELLIDSPAGHGTRILARLTLPASASPSGDQQDKG